MTIIGQSDVGQIKQGDEGTVFCLNVDGKVTGKGRERDTEGGRKGKGRGRKEGEEV